MFLNEIRRMGGLAGFEGKGLERVVRLAFVNGFPDSISCDLQQMAGVLEVEMGEIVSRARILTARKNVGSDSTVAAAMAVDRSQVAGRQMSGHGTDTRTFRGSCFQCGGPHMAKFCKTRSKGDIICYRCNKPGHVANRCTQLSGNEKGVTTAPVVTRHH